jgi:hypothetical protein
MQRKMWALTLSSTWWRMGRTLVSLDLRVRKARSACAN